MFGQSELDDLLAQPNLRQINQRIGFSFNTGPLSMAEAVHYMSHRVKCSRVDGVDFPVFTEGAMSAIAQAAGFVPRVINILADKALLVAYGEGAIQVAAKHAELAIDDSPQLAKKITLQRGWVRRTLMGVIALEAAAVIALFTFSPGLQSWAKGTWTRVTGGAAVSVPAAPASAVQAPSSHTPSSQANAAPPASAPQKQ
ncbi:MAG: hypothetical protein JNK21_14810, partial [Rhodospirillaceae bacterium]|nr:hypothetical protein [Rhodospirillaceae bacterium]